MNLQGFCDSRFNAVREEFERNFLERGEIGASVCLLLEGEPVVDLWGGMADRLSGKPWEKDTLCLVWSCTKGATAILANLFCSRFKLELDASVAKYWPEFAQGGKDDTTIRMLLCHQAGLPVIQEPLKPGGLYDWDYMIGRLERQKPLWTPGTRQAYHSQTFGFLVGELIQRVSGKAFNQVFQEEICQPLGIEFYIGLPEQHEARVAATSLPDIAPKDENLPLYLTRATRDPTSLQAVVLKNTGRFPGARDYDSAHAHRAVLPGQGGITHARGLAGLYSPVALGGTVKGRAYLNEEILCQMGCVQSASLSDATLLIGIRLSLGFWKSSDNRSRPPGLQDSFILSEDAFGHPGMGGSLGFADPKARISFGYVMNKQGRGVCLNERGQNLVDAVYRSLGYRSNKPGRWIQ